MKFEILKPEAICGAGKKAIQEDCMFPALGEGTIHDRLFIVADGIGGDGKGFMASEYLCKTVSDYFYQNTCSDEPLEDVVLDKALECAREKLNDSCGDSFGTSFALLYFHRHGCLAAHVGNSKIYHIRPKEHKLLYRSADNNGVFAPGSGSNMTLTKAKITQVRYGDYFVLMTQGAKQVIDEDELMDIVCEPVNDKTKLLRLSKHTSLSEDNNSLYLVHVSGVMNEALDENLADNEQLLMQQYATVEAAKETEGNVGQEQQRDVANENKRQQNKVQQQPQSSQSQRLQSSQNQPTQNSQNKKQQFSQPKPNDDNDLYLEERDHKGRDFPIVTVTACLIVLMALGFWYFSQREKDKVEEAPVVEVKKPQGKDTINIMKNAKPKPLTDLDDAKAKEEEAKKKEEEKRKRQEQMAAESQKAAMSDSSTGTPVTPSQLNVQEPVQSSASQATSTPAKTTPATSTTTPANNATPNNTATPSNQTQQSNGDPTVVTPRPVIPEGE